MVGYSHTNLLFRSKVIIILIVAICLLLFNNTWSPCILFCPRNIFQIQNPPSSFQFTKSLEEKALNCVLPSWEYHHTSDKYNTSPFSLNTSLPDQHNILE